MVREVGRTPSSSSPSAMPPVSKVLSGAVARRRKVDAGEVTIESAVGLLPTGDGGFKLTVALDVSLPAVADRDMAAELVRGAHQVCPYSNATRGNIEVELLLDGAAL